MVLQSLADWGAPGKQEARAALVSWGEFVHKFRVALIAAIILGIVTMIGGVWTLGLAPYWQATAGAGVPQP